MAVLAHLSDLHFGRINTDVVRALLRELAQARPDLIVISGDLTQHALHGEFKRAGAFLAQLPAPHLTVPGNHDIPAFNVIERFLAPFTRYRRYIGDNFCPLFKHDAFIALGLNTARPYGPYWDWSRGRISHHQMRLVHEHFAAVPEHIVKIVVTHHPFLLSPETLGRQVVGRRRQALEQFRHCRVDLLLSGHLHRAYSDILPIHHAQGRSAMIVAQAATATSTRLKDEPNAYNWITLEPGAVTIENRRWSGHGFSAFSSTRFLKENGSWRPVPDTLQADRKAGNTNKAIKH